MNALTKTNAGYSRGISCPHNRGISHLHNRGISFPNPCRCLVDGIYRYIYIIRVRHFSSTGPVRNVGGVKCQSFLKHSNHWKRAIKMIFKASGCFQFPEALLLLRQKKAYTLLNAVHYKFLLFYRNSHVQLLR